MSENVKAGGGADKPEKPKKKRGNPFSKWYREYKAEFKKIVWPTILQTRNGTAVVIVVVIFLSLLIGLLDFLFSSGYSFMINLAK